MHWGWGFGGVGMIFWWLIIAALVVALFYRGHRGGYDGRSYYSSANAMEILKERYAKGELTEEEFKKMRQNLEE